MRCKCSEEMTMVFNHDVWPENELDLVDYGDDEIQNLISWFRPVLERYLFKMY